MTDATKDMRLLMEHAAAKLEKAQGGYVSCGGGHTGTRDVRLPTDAYIAMAYAEGVLRLLSTYLKVENDA